MSKIKEQFVTYEIALKLKELGFNEECLAYYHDKSEPYLCRYLDSNNGAFNINCRHVLFDTDCTAPLWQQAQSFLDDNGMIIGIIFVDNVFKYTLNIENYVSNRFKDRMSAIKSATEYATNYLWNKKFNK